MTPRFHSRAAKAFLLLLALAACRQESLVQGPGRNLRMRDRYRYLVRKTDTPENDSTVAPKPAIYYTALAFPSWADWRDGDLRGGEIVLYKNGAEQLRVPAGDNPDPERHRVRNGHLWTDYIEGKETVIACDGEPTLRYNGEEVLMGFLLVGRQIHTLGQRPGGQGFSYRIDGKEVFSDPAGVVVGTLNQREWPGGALTKDLPGVCYSYGVPIRSGDKTEWEYRVMCGDSCIRMIPQGTSARLHDLRIQDGTVYRVEQRSASSTTTCLVRDNSYHSLGMGPSEEAHGLQLVPLEDGTMGVKGYSSGLVSADKWTCWYRDETGIRAQASGSLEIHDLFVEGDHLAWCTLRSGTVCQVIQDGHLTGIAPYAYRLATPLCACWYQGALLALLSSVDGPDHLILHGDTLTPISFNGYFTSVYCAP